MFFNSEKFRKLKTHFNQKDLNGEGFSETKVGIFLTTPTAHILKAWKILIDRKYLNENDVFLDAGSGDGRIIMTNGILGIKSYGIEYEESIYKKSLKNKQCFLENYNIEPQLTCGDFLDNATYEKFNMSFENFNVIFNFANNHKPLVDKIIKQSKKGTLFILAAGYQNMPIYENLTLKDTFIVSSQPVFHKQYDKITHQILGTPKEQKGYFFVYER